MLLVARAQIRTDVRAEVLLPCQLSILVRYLMAPDGRVTLQTGIRTDVVIQRDYVRIRVRPC